MKDPTPELNYTQRLILAQYRKSSFAVIDLKWSIKQSQSHIKDHEEAMKTLRDDYERLCGRDLELDYQHAADVD